MKKLIRNNADLLEFQAQLYAVAQELAEGKTFDASIEPHREKRSLNANNYSWVLQDQMSKILNISIDEMHTQMVLRYGVLETMSIREDAYESAKRVFEYFYELGRSQLNGKKYVHVRVGVGTHHYNTKEMSDFLNGVINEAKDLGIQTLEDKQIEELVQRWQK